MKPAAYLFLIAILLSVPSVQAQKEASVSARYTLILGDNENMTIRQARLKAIEMARSEAIREVFGALVVTDQLSSERAVNERETSVFMSDTRLSVRGEWLGDEREPQVTLETDGQNIMFTAQVWGKAREIVRGNTDVKWQVMKDVSGIRVESDAFNSGERIYVNFSSPVDGYVAVYLVGDDGSASCLLPYPKDPAGQYRVKHNARYTFFDRSADSDPAAKYYKLSTGKLQEYNQIYLIFSPNPFTKCTDRSIGTRTPNVLDQSDFSKWLLGQQRADKDMLVLRKWIEITSNE